MNSNTQFLMDMLAENRRKLADLQEQKKHVAGARARIRRLRKEVRNRRTGMDRLKEIDREVDAINSDVYGGGMEDLERRIIRRRRRRKVLLLLAIAIMIEFWGVPHLRMTYRTSGGGQHVHSANYLSVTGWKKSVAGQYGEGCPLIAFIPLERSLIDYAGDAGMWIWSAGSGWLKEEWSNLSWDTFS